MNPIDFPIERLNEFLKNHSFIIKDPFGDGLNEKINLSVKVQLTGLKPMISIGEWKDFIEYTLYLEDMNTEFGKKILGNIFKTQLRTNNYKLSNTDTRFYLITVKVNDMLRNFLKYWSVDNPVICTRIINNLPEPNQENLKESLISEGKYDNIVRKLVKDILNIAKFQNKGEFVLPEDIENKMTYNFPQFSSPFTIELTLDTSEDIDKVDVDGAYYRDDDVIEISILTNPNLSREILEELHFELNELIRHELEHIVQYDRGDNIPETEPTKPLKYYTQPHELEAQIAGFKRRAKKERKPLIEVIRSWFEKNKSKHRLSPKNVEVVINRILELAK